MKKKSLFILLVLIAMGTVSITGCKKDDDDASPSTPAPSTTAAKSFINLSFNKVNAYFSTDGSMSAPVDSNQAKTITSKIDLTFIYSSGYDEPGFLDPIARSQTWYWNEYNKTWLSTAVETRFYSTSLTKADFDAAQADESKIAGYFASANTVLAPHGIFPTGSCIGGRQSSNPTSIYIRMEKVYGFKNTTTGKRGLIYVRDDQSTGWPTPVFSNITKVDIIREN